MSKHECEIGQLVDHHGLRCSKDRHAIIALFQRPRPWSGAQLQKALRHTARSTIFNNLQMLIRGKLITPTNIHGDEGQIFYEWTGRKHHDHLICEKCAAPECVPCPIPRLKKHLLELRGLCSQCK